ncbi:PBP1A family penicillin-binding protein [Enterococcus xiangfangensis]|uniref:PBP1A family penicillin-binding protein n=1 Tax=Enterococcus xiangfangensis TaxID=1296537 RepID=A0ABU3FCA8_9ENTE|nr:PBP1A family penicillin-binding protein [Enterococcus xiangfangensis]MBM7711833.1 penicillin-binding protein 1A [Enterococcus xiangfangensis]MDT2760294.1 PBP1A family penicillin-binding protein [Enterococcus xiangfangensis]NBK07441.1 PBP1A family penicillin-binding protein [Enterococcus asini]
MANPSRSQKNKRTPKGKKPTLHNPKKRHIGLKILIALFGLLCAALLFGIGLFFFYVKDAPPLSEKKLDATVSSKLYDSDGNIFEDLGAEKREKVSATKIPQELDDAIISVEDRRFFKHNGVDPVRIMGSLVHNVTNEGGLQGGSTLTQQLVKLSFFSTKTSDQTLRRKAQEAWLAIQLEKKNSKQEILTYYINKVYMANGLYGMETAAEAYFGKELQYLTIAQTALLAGMPQAPNSYDPYQHPEAAKERRDTVLYTMLNNKKISQTDYDKATKEPIDEGLLPLETDNQERKVADNYVKEVIAQVEEKTGKNVYTDGLEIYTNLDTDAQNQLYSIVNGDEYVQYPDESLQIAATLIDSETGKVSAQIGGRNIADDVYLGMNRAVTTNRDFGSTVKPITDYGPAFEYLQKSTGDRISDSPYTYEGTKTEVKNWDNSYQGSITLRQALYDSRNVPAVKLFNEVGAENVGKFLKKLGIQYKDIQQANAISSNTEAQDGTKYGISTEKMAAAYAAFANGGTYNEPLYINKIKYQDGSEQTFSAEGEKAMEPYTAYMVTDILKDVISKGTGTKAQITNLFQAGKTGTSNYTDDELAKIAHYGSISPEVMFTGFTPHYSLSIWAGYDDRMTPITSQSEGIAQDVYREFMSYISQNVSNEDWKMPDDVLRIGNELYVKGASSIPSQSSYSAQSSYYNTTSFSQTTDSSSSVEPATSVSESASVVPSESSAEETPPVSSADPVPSSSAEQPPASSAEQPEATPDP